VTIAYEASGNAASGFASSLTFALNAGSNADRVVLVFASTDRGSASTIDSATYAGVSMTALSGFLSSPTGIDGRLFYLVGAASGSNNVVITYSDSGIRPRAVAAAYSGVSGVSDPQNVSPSFGSTISATVTSASGDLVVLIGCQLGRTSVAPSSPAVERFDAAMPSSTVYGYVWDEAGAASVTIDGTAPGTTEWWAAALNLQAAGGGGVTGTGSITLGDVTSAATGSLALSGAAAITLGNVSSAGTGTLSIAGAAGITLGNVLLASTGSVQTRGALAVTLGNVTLTATGGSTNTGQVAVTLGDVTTSSAASLSLNAQAGGTLGAVTLAATGSVLVSGAVATTLGDVTLVATGVLGNTVTGSAAITLGNVTMASAGSLTLAGTADIALGNVTTTSAGTLALAGSAAITLGNVTSAGSGSVAIRGQMMATLGNVTLQAAGGLDVPTVDGPAGYGYPPTRRPISRQRNNDYMFRPRTPNTRR
jgi:hypothetical protein